MGLSFKDVAEEQHISFENFNGKTQTEKELCFWVRVPNHDFLQELEGATATTMVQAEFPLKDTVKKYGRMRIRLENDEEGSLTTKIYTKDSRAVEETTVPLTKDIFQQMLLLTESHLRKVRYTVPTEDGLKWELDVHDRFTWNEDDALWVKVDLEFNDDEMELPPFPFKFDEIIMCGPKMTPEQKQKVDYLMSCYRFGERGNCTYPFDN